MLIMIIPSFPSTWICLAKNYSRKRAFLDDLKLDGQKQNNYILFNFLLCCFSLGCKIRLRFDNIFSLVLWIQLNCCTVVRSGKFSLNSTRICYILFCPSICSWRYIHLRNKGKPLITSHAVVMKQRKKEWMNLLKRKTFCVLVQWEIWSLLSIVWNKHVRNTHSWCMSSKL